ncbi:MULTISPECIES: hypothetical protein [Acinetobacter]|uniref:hypothetical protein n=1 Tax=Acinetobacter TaxID=469 RepID=UPI0025C64716|nr:hypothetical protein [Acinetobacter sp. UBA3025]
MTTRNIFLSYASGSFIQARDELCQSALAVGFDEARARGPEHLDPAFVEENQDILSQSRGAGYWLWKPQIILQELRKLKEGDLLVYSDAGRSSYYQFKSFPKNCISLTKKHGFVLGPTIGQHGPMSKWTKRDAFILLDMDKPEIYNLPPIQATYSFWTPCPKAFEFLEEWLEACQDPRILTDMENTQGLSNLDDFQDHRHDQTVISLLAYKYNAPFMDYRGTFIEKLLLLRPQSRFAHMFLKRIYDVELTYKRSILKTIQALNRCWSDFK